MGSAIFAAFSRRFSPGSDLAGSSRAEWSTQADPLTFTGPTASARYQRGHVTEPNPESTGFRPRRRPPRIAPVVLGAVLVAGIVAGWYLLRRPRLVFTNRLAAPVWVAVGQAAPVSIPPGTTQRLAWSGGGSQVVQWNLARPLSADQRPMGEELRGSLVVREPKGTIHQTATARGTDLNYFAPLVTNATETLLRVKVNAGLEGSVDCGCAVRPGTRRVFIGYYRLYRNSTVQATDSLGRRATFRDLGPSVTTVDGTVGLRFRSKDLR
jgi:hypothetical protein